MRIFERKKGWEVEWQFAEERDYLAAILNGLCGLSPNLLGECKNSGVEPVVNGLRQSPSTPIAESAHEELISA